MTSLLDRLFSLNGRTALVTGASGGIGRALAVALSEVGAAVGVHGRNVSELQETLRQIEERGGTGVLLPADLSDVTACRSLVDEAQTALGRLDILVNCAGMNRRAPASQAKEEDFEAIIAANLRSVYFLCQEAYPIMTSQGGGKIINIGSVASSWGLGGVSVYGMTKGAVAQLTKTLAVEWARDNIQVNCLAPGFIKTGLTEKALWGDPIRSRWLYERIPARRPGTPDDLLGAALLLASPASAYLTGQILTVDGGFLAGGWWE